METNGTNMNFWAELDSEIPPFLKLESEEKDKGFQVKFLENDPKKQKESRFDSKKTECWFDIIYYQGNEQSAKTWTINQISLLKELKRHSPIKDKILEIKLVKVDKAWLEKFPKYKGKHRYHVTQVN